MDAGWMVFAPRESVKVRSWYGMASKWNRKDLENLEGRGWDMDDSNTDGVEYEPWMGF